MRWMIYGANGYTGELIAREARQRGLSPVLAGRSAGKVAQLAQSLGLEHRAFGLESPAEVAAGLEGMGLVLHCAGPFSATAAPMMDGCLATKVRYLDITGEIDVLELAQTLTVRAKQAGVVLCPGVGFDVIPTDCVATALKEALPDATHLSLGFETRSGFSPGTAKTAVEGLPQGGRVRRDGKIVSTPPAFVVRRIDFGDGEKLAMTVPWGDVSTAYHSTGIPNIEVFFAAAPSMIANAKRVNYFRWLLAFGFVQSLIKRSIEKNVKGPDEAARASLPTFVWGEVVNGKGQKKTGRIRTANGYSVTVTGSLAIVDFLLKGRPTGGAYTPSKLIGPDLVIRLPGSGPLTIQ